MASCTDCILHEGRTNVVAGDGPVPCDIMIIGEGPGEQEDLSGRPFVGPAGRKLDDALSGAGISRAEVFIANTVACRPPNNRRPGQNELDACFHHLLNMVATVNPICIILLGASALRDFFPDLKISSVRGHVIDKGAHNPRGDKLPCYFMPTYHPAAALRSPQMNRDFMADMKGFEKWVDENTEDWPTSNTHGNTHG